MNGKTVYLHIGLHKTGTTSLQVFLTERRAELAAQGYLYPQAGCPPWKSIDYAQHLLPWSLFKHLYHIPTIHGRKASFQGEEKTALWRSLRAEIEAFQGENIIISSEEFDVFDREEMNELAGHLRGFDIVPVVFLRNHCDLLESAYRTAITYSGYTREVSEFLLRPRIRLDFAQMARDWRGISPSNRLVIVAYDDPSVRRDVLTAFLRIIGVDATRLKPAKQGRSNESVPAFVCQLIKQLRLDGRSDEEVGKWTAWAVKLDYDKGVNDRYGLLPSDARHRLMDTYMQEVISIARDPALKPSVIGDLGGRSAIPAPRVIATPSEALIALGNEVGSC